MSKTYRMDFTKGTNVVGDKTIIPEGFATILDNVDLRSGAPKPFRAPEYQFPVAPTTSRAWSYRGRWFTSTNWRDYVGEFISGIERVYASEEGAIPSKFIGGQQVVLGTLVPQLAPIVTKTSNMAPSGLTATIAYGSGNLQPGERLYRVSARTADGILPPTSPVTVTIPTADSTHSSPQVVLVWGQVAKATGYIIWEGDQTDQYRLDEVPPGTLTYTDNGAKTASGDGASQYLQNQEFSYAYSYRRNVNQVFDEGGLSFPSVAMSAATGRLVTRDPLTDGFFSLLLPDGTLAVRSATGTISSTSAAQFAPLVLTEATGIASTSLVVGKAYKIATVGGADYTTVGSKDNVVGTRFYATGTSAGGAGTVNESRAVYEGATLMTKINYLAHGLVSDDRVQFQGFTDPVWSNQTYDVIYIDANNFAISGVKAPTDASPWDSAHKVQPQKTLVTMTTISATSMVSGYYYKITTAGSTDFTTLGAASNAVGTLFTYNGVTAGGTGTVTTVAPFTGDATYLVGSGTGQTVSGLYKATQVTDTTFTVPLLAVQTAGSITLSTIQWIPYNNYYDKWELYRNEQGIWNLVDEGEMWETSITDAKPFAALGGPPTSFYIDNGITIDYAPAPLGLTGFESHYGMLFAINGHTVRWTPQLQADAWPDVFSVTLPYKPVALASYSQGLIILCQDAIYRLDGNSPTGMSLAKTLAEDGCFAPHSVQKTDRGLVYLSKRGVMLFNGTTAVCLTDTRINGFSLTAPSTTTTPYTFWWLPTIMTRIYQDLAGEDSILGSIYKFPLDNTQTVLGLMNSIKSFYHQGKYYLFYTGPNYALNTAFCLDLQLPSMPITSLGMKILDAHVNEFEQAFILIDNSPSPTTVTITSPL